MSSVRRNPAVSLAYSWALREYRALGYRGTPDGEQYGTLLHLVSLRLRSAFPRIDPHERGAAARAGLDQALLDIATGFARAGVTPMPSAPDRITQAWHGLTIQLARGLPTRLAEAARSRTALRRAAA